MNNLTEPPFIKKRIRTKKVDNYDCGKIHQLKQLEENIFNVSSLNDLIKNDSTKEFLDDVCSNEPGPEENFQAQLLKELLEKTIDCGTNGNALSERERGIIALRYFSNMKLDDIAVVYDVTHERIRQIEMKALEKLKRSLQKKGIKEISDII